MKPMIQEIIDPAGIRASVKVIRESFLTVAPQFGLTIDNCPSHPSNITLKQLEESKKKGLKFFGLFLGEKQVGFIAIETGGDGIFYLEKLALLPEYRHAGYGADLVKFTFNYARKNNGLKVAIGIINKHTVLKEWYKGLGFVETGTKKFDHLPFTVGFMEMTLAP
jgi:GNAT superfamily N-acetyltransferase